MFHAKVEVVKREVKKMMEMGVIEPAASPFCSPIVLVKKKYGQVRFCVDFSKQNKVTVFDAEPTLEKADALAVFQLSPEDNFRGLKYD